MCLEGPSLHDCLTKGGYSALLLACSTTVSVPQGPLLFQWIDNGILCSIGRKGSHTQFIEIHRHNIRSTQLTIRVSGRKGRPINKEVSCLVPYLEVVEATLEAVEQKSVDLYR